MPQRLLRPGITTSKRWNRCDYFSQSLWVRLLTLVDDHGRFEADPELLRSLAFPYGDPSGNVINVTAIADSCQQLSAAKLIDIYDVDGKKFLQLLKWKERIRSESRFPTPQKSDLLTNDSKCQQMIASPPTPSPSPTPSPTPDASKCGRGEERQVQLPPGFPKNEAEATVHAAFAGCPDDFAAKTYNKAMQRGGRDSHDVPIRSWRHHLKTEYVYEQERIVHNNSKANRAATPQRVDRSIGTANEGTANLYRGLGKVAQAKQL